MAKILIIDDDPEFQEFVCALFEIEGHEPHAAFDGPTGLELYRQVEPDIVLLDVMMPGVDGYEVCRHLREDLGATLPIVFVSARTSPEDSRRGQAAGCDAFVTKPFDFPALMELVTDRLAGR